MGKLMKCPLCGENNTVGEQFCANCGAALNASYDDATLVQTGASAFSDHAVPASSASSENVPGAVSGEAGSTTTLLPGVELQQGRYVVERLLGQGGMGAAVLARDTRVSNKRVVIKELISDETDPEKRQEDVRNFEREVATLAHMDHPLIPSVTDSFQEDTRYYMVQVYVPGENLEKRLERVGRPLPEKDVLEYAGQVLAMLEYLARLQPPIVHRDIKPANIIISSNDHLAHLVDFGIARADEAKKSQRKQTTALGTPGYAPPEQYQGNADARSDMFALAATMHHLLTNRDPRDEPPFQYPPARTLNPALSPDIERVLERALSLNIEQRYQSATEMKHEIDDILLNRFGDAEGVVDTGTGASMYTHGYTGSISRVRSSPLNSPRATREPIRPWSETLSGPLGGTEQAAASRSGQQQQQMFEPREFESAERRPDNVADYEAESAYSRSTGQYAPPAFQQRPQFRMANSPAMMSFLILLLAVGAILFLLLYLLAAPGAAPTPPPF